MCHFVWLRIILHSEHLNVLDVFITKSTDIVAVFSCSADGTISSIDGSAQAKDPSEPAKLLVTFFESKKDSFTSLSHRRFVFHWQFITHLHPLQTLPLLLTGCSPQITTATPWCTAAPTWAWCTWTLPGSWAESPLFLRKPSGICRTPFPPSESEWTSWSTPSRTRSTAVPCSLKMLLRGGVLCWSQCNKLFESYSYKFFTSRSIL